METLSSLKNPKVALWRSLKDGKGRRESGCFLAEGRKMTREALSSGLPVEALLVEAERAAEFPLPEGVPAYVLPGHVFAAVCDTRTPQGIAAVVRLPGTAAVSGRLIVLDGVQDPGNVGTILRTADCAGLDGAILSDTCADPFSPKVLRATMGSIFRVPLCVTADLPAMLAGLKAQGYAILSTQLDGSPFYDREPAGDRYCLVIGSEGNGVSPPIRDLATQRLRLPMRGGAESLNAAVSAGIMMYDLTRG